VQIKLSESPALLPTLDALNAEFGCEDQPRATGRRRQRDASMDATLRQTQSDFLTDLRAARPKADAMRQSSVEAAIMQPSLAPRALRGLTPFLAVFCIGIAATLAWQSYGDAARAMIATSSPKLDWLAPQAAWLPQTAPETVPSAPAVAPSPDVQQLALAVVSVRESIDQLAAQLVASQQEISDKIAKLQTHEQDILRKVSAALIRPTAAPLPKAASVTAPSASAR
jgi:hypothetical protein